MIESTPVFADGFGRRVVRVGREDPPDELLQIDPALAQHPRFADALRERVARFAGLRLTSYARALKVETDAHGGVTLVSEYVKGWRLADLLDVAETENLIFDIGVVMLLLRQLLPTAAMLSNQIKDSASGALGPEHLLLTAQGRIVLTDYVLGPAIDTLGWTPDRLWATLRVATPPGADVGAVSPRADVAQLGVTVLSLVVGRRLRDDEFPDRLEVLVGSARQRTPTVVDAPLSEGLRGWLTRSLQLAPRSFASLFEARLALEQLLGTETALIAQPMELDLAMSRLERLMPVFELPTPPAPPPAPKLLDMPAPNHDWVLPAVAFDKPPKPKAVPQPPEIVKTWQTAAAAVAELPVPPLPVAAAMATPAAVTEAVPVAVPQAAVSSPAADTPLQRELVPTAAADASAAPAPASRQPAWARIEPPASAVDPVEAPAPPVAVPWWRSVPAVAALAGLVVLQGALIGWQLSRPAQGLSGDGELVVQSRPDGARVAVDDEDRGVTPLTLRLAPGTHVLQLRVGSGEPRVIPLQIHAGVQTAQYVEMQGVSTTGVLEVRSEPSRARVTIDGEARGSTPLTLRDVAPGDYQVVLERAGWKSTQVVRVEPGATAQLVVPIR